MRKGDYAVQVVGSDYCLTQGNDEPKARDEQGEYKEDKDTQMTKKSGIKRERDQGGYRERD